MIVISVSKRWYHPRSEVRQHGKNGAKKRWFVFYLDEGRFRSKRIHWYEVWWYKSQKHYKARLICSDCDREFIGYIRSVDQEVECPYCDN